MESILGYDKCSEIAKEARISGKPIKQILIEKGYMQKKEVQKILNVKYLTRPNL